MSESEDIEQGNTPSGRKSRYESPTLLYLGKLRDLTTGGSGTVEENADAGTEDSADHFP